MKIDVLAFSIYLINIIHDIKTILSSTIIDMWQRLQNLKEKILRSRLFERTRSVEVTSKQKKEFDHKQPLSIDSKQKEYNLVAPEKQNSLVKMNDFDHC